MRKTLIILLSLILLFSLCGCTGEGLNGEILHFGFENAEYLLIDAGTAESTVKITDKNRLHSYAEEFGSHKYIKTITTEDDSYCYSFEWYDGNGMLTARIYIIEENGYQIRFDGEDYRVAGDRNIRKELYQDLFE